jgi:uncharacterized DUF497 family protein
MALKFDWDPDKARSNREKHNVSFIEAASVFSDPFSITQFDTRHAAEEDRYLILGYSDRQRLLVVVYTERTDYIRVISARPATRIEKNAYEQDC